MSTLSPGRFEVDVVFDELAARRGGPKIDPAKQRESIRRRLIMCGAGLAAAFAILGLRTTQLALDTPPPVYKPEIVAADQGPARLLDREGRALALTVKGFGLAIDGKEVWDPAEAAAGIARIFPHVDPIKLSLKLEAKQRVVIDRVISEKQREQVLALGLPGVTFPEEDIRAYPQGRLFSHVVGYQIPGRGGVTGLEAAVSSQELTGLQKTTLHIAAQAILLGELARAQEQFGAKAAWGVLMDARDGSVVAMVSLPDFDPNVPGASPAAARRNRTVSDTYEMGSAFKAVTIALAMEQGLVDLDTPVDVTSPLQVGDWAIEDYSEKGNVLTVEEILAYSSNIGTAQLALLMGKDGFTDALDRFGLRERMSTTLPESRSPLLPQQWGPAELATVSYGHGIAVSPLQLTAAFAALVNGGRRVTPRFLASDPVDGERLLSPEVSLAMRKALRTSVTKGTGGKAEAPGFYVIGKTATADKPGVGGYDDNGPLVSSFIGAFPGYDPQYVLLVSLDEPQGTPETYGFATAGWTAAPAFKRTVERLAPVLGIFPARDDVAADGFLTVLEGAGQEPTPQGGGSASEGEAR
ncbi:peptidoglycan D,D-transpeptidase FtsI family protein [Parvularcula lutaonensis]|uniref:Peptidoglycan D,D-transpeptidase FtsI family protein n=1 Tax=Parvularcula lutaonensis TaxID=491923 RepID=A0ABV7M8R0_9PROT|nr:penicillin-binding protein 2 [Parvularcula lutaonensis]GGY41673.1 peptidoglycan glycosyltransferase [Parvularcula lutaonensis]